MRNNHNKLCLPTTNRFKISNRLFICQPHSPSHCSYHNPNPMKLHRSNSTNSSPWTHIINTILPSQYQL
uniref:Uncharacterized protein n=1 Tax=Sciurus vulgaris TaxID=55149 RepID=A0A8D2DLN3_SCIVU